MAVFLFIMSRANYSVLRNQVYCTHAPWFQFTDVPHAVCYLVIVCVWVDMWVPGHKNAGGQLIHCVHSRLCKKHGALFSVETQLLEFQSLFCVTLIQLQFAHVENTVLSNYLIPSFVHLKNAVKIVCRCTL